MKVGLTYDLRDDYIARGFSEEAAGEFDAPETIDAIADALEALGHRVERIGALPALVKALARGNGWDLVFNICEGVAGIAREAQVPALLEAYAIPCTFAAADVLVTAMDKSLAKLIVRQHGVPTPDFAVVRSASEIGDVALPFPLFVKPLAEGTSKGVQETSKVLTTPELSRKCLEVLATYGQPALVETYLPGREYTVGILGDGPRARAVGVVEITFKPGGDTTGYSYRNKMQAFDQFTLVTGSAAQPIGDVALSAWRALGCRDAGRVDIREDAAGQPAFIEVNPLAGLRPGWSELAVLAEMSGMSYQSLIGAIVESASARIGARCAA